MPEFSRYTPTASAPLNTILGATPVGAVNAAMGYATTGPEVPVLAVGINALIEKIKNFRWFHEQTWTDPLVIVLSFGVAGLIWWVFAGENAKAIINGFGVLAQTHINYQGTKVTGLPILAPTPEENRWRPV